MKEIQRWARNSVLDAFSIWRCVFLAGVRQCGKTTLAHQCTDTSMVYRTMDDSAQLQVARMDPAGFVRRNAASCMVIDEVQKVPELLLEIKLAVDRDNTKGQYLLTGSANLSSLPAVTESLAGRMGIIRLRTLSDGEIRGEKPSFVERAFHGDFPATYPSMDRRAVLESAFRGGFPEAMELRYQDRREWFRSYLDALLLHDIRQLMDIRAYQILRRLAEAMLARSGRFFTENELSATFGIKHETLLRLQSILKTLFLMEEVPAWAQGDYAAIRKRSKWYASDTGMVASVLGWNPDEVFLDPDRSGKIIETWVHHELSVQLDLHPEVRLFQFRDQYKREIDFVLDGGSAGVVGVEVKAGSGVRSDDFKNMEWFRSRIVGNRPFEGIVLYTGNQTLRFGEGFHAVPMASLCY